MKFGVIVFPGSNCDRDIVTVTRGLLNQPTRMIWHTETDVSDCDVVVIPGGFSYGDYLRCGAIARFSPVMAAVSDHARRGRIVLGICNGFQVLSESGLLPGALVRNRNLQFVCNRVSLKVERNDLAYTTAYTKGQVIEVPIAHGEGCYYADAATLEDLEASAQVVFRYTNSDGLVTPEANPNGSLNNIAGICNKAGNVLGMMPHPERASDPALGATDGLPFFKSLVACLAVV
ncbi:MAG: phosphoribosylformylglycinamidine synthase subunit PurQ [Anaerolineae bacterium]|nr:phosphoribosylformylglycinamidine synthase subunit PurQ [Gloeobacterales cyanobacterium ES-bin-313]